MKPSAQQVVPFEKPNTTDQTMKQSVFNTTENDSPMKSISRSNTEERQ